VARNTIRRTPFPKVDATYRSGPMFSRGWPEISRDRCGLVKRKSRVWTRLLS